MSLALSEQQLRIVRAILAERLPGPACALGSRVKGAHRPYSDLDLAIDNTAPLTFAQAGDLAEAFSESDLPFKVDVVDWRSVRPEFQAIVDRDGVDLTAPPKGA